MLIGDRFKPLQMLTFFIEIRDATFHALVPIFFIATAARNIVSGVLCCSWHMISSAFKCAEQNTFTCFGYWCIAIYTEIIIPSVSFYAITVCTRGSISGILSFARSMSFTYGIDPFNFVTFSINWIGATASCAVVMIFFISAAASSII